VPTATSVRLKKAWKRSKLRFQTGKWMKIEDFKHETPNSMFIITKHETQNSMFIITKHETQNSMFTIT
jgi:hypothetical protein